jgi:hypothetical protein
MRINEAGRAGGVPVSLGLMSRGIVAIWILSTALGARDVSAQRSAPVGVVRPASRVALLVVQRVPRERQRPRAWPFVVGGAVVGGAAMAGAIAIYFERTDAECICSPFAFVPAVAAGGAVGAGLGYVVYRVAF